MRRRWQALAGFITLGAVVFAGYWGSVPKPPADPNTLRSAAKGVGTGGNPKGDGQEWGMVTTPDEFVRMALADALTLPVQVRPYVRYLSVRDHEDLKHMRTCSLVMNLISRSSYISRPMPVAGGRLLRVDLRVYAPREGDLAEWLNLWERLSFDPNYSLLLTRDTLEFAGIDVRTLPKRTVRKPPPAKWKVTVPDGQPWSYPEWALKQGTLRDPQGGTYEIDVAPGKIPPGFVAVEQVEVGIQEGDVVRYDAPHVDPQAFKLLQAELKTTAPVCDHLYFKGRVLSTVKRGAVKADKGKVFETVFGGLYYEFRGARRGAGKDAGTDLDGFLERLGVGDGKAGSATALFDRLRSDMRLAVFRSGVTGKPREVSMFHVLSEKEGGSWGAITGDISDESIDVGDRPYANLLNPRREAREAIFPGPNGMPVYALFDGKGALQDEVPFNIAVDRTIPSPQTARLQGAESCIACHWKEDGWLQLTNDVTKLVGEQLDIFDDIGAGKKRMQPDTIDRLYGLYQGNFQKPLRRARDDMAETVLKASGPWEGSADQTDIVRLSGAYLTTEVRGWKYDLVTPKQACRELGYNVPEREAVNVLRRLLPPDGGSAVYGVVPEDPRIGGLLADLSIPRTDWALAYGYAAGRASKSPFGRSMARARRWLGN